ncbi:hypothetical protein O181_014167 [Austropuccinia psidii MF-1]|uniref:non-specific serine/threonine protein kinase n=1 Tax=Austropuccinia psidii MF-1 TaxID=1389203 RepID=A0A9Q3C149_9BASI|nr:hypothetical protein [Austropuccinia psidii MF-1]
MGNVPSNNLNRPTGLTLDSFVSELGVDIFYEKSLATTRFLKTIRARHKYGRIVVKVFVKTDPSFSLKGFVKRLKAERGLIQDVPNVLTYQRTVVTEKAGYLIRQWLSNNLYDRISTRPFLSLSEKKWIAFQLLTAMCDSWERGVAHGDIKSENVIVTSWNWVYVTDFSAAFKPTYLPEDDPADFSYFFDTSSRRSCYIAPERFYSTQTEIEAPNNEKLVESMDVFSLGCVIGELFREGSSPFTLSQMFNYKAGEYSVDPYLRGIEDEKIRELVRSMIQLKPEDRLSFKDYLTNSQHNKTFPNSFYIFLHPFLLSLQELSGPFNPPTSLKNPKAQVTVMGSSNGVTSRPTGELTSHSILRNEADRIIEKLWSDFDYVSRYIGSHKRKTRSTINEAVPAGVPTGFDPIVTEHEGSDCQPTSHAWSSFPLRIHVPGHSICMRSTPDASKSSTDDDIALAILSILSSNIRSCLHPSSIVKALDLYLALLDNLTDETILDRVLPYLVSLLNARESCDLVKSKTLFCLTQVLLLVDMITPSNSFLFPEYLIPNLKHLANDTSELVRSTLAKCIGPLALISKRFLNLTQVMKQKKRIDHDTLQLNSGEPLDTYESSYDYSLNELHRQFQEIVVSLLTDSSTLTKRSLLTSLSDLSKFFGRVKTNEILLAHILTYLNENDWILRAAFFEHLVDIVKETGPFSVEEYILPMMMQALADSEEFVSVRVINALIEIVKRELLSEHKLWELIAAVMVVLSHPNSWIRRASAQLIVTVSQVLRTTDVWCILYPALRKFLRCDIEVLNEWSILTNLEAPIPRIVYEATVTWAGRRQQSSPFWQLTSATANTQRPQTTTVSPSPQGSAPSRQSRSQSSDNHALLSEEDTAQLSKLRQIGMKSVDETRLKNMRQHIAKVADARSRLPPPNTSLEASNLLDKNDVSLQDFGIPLHNILLKNCSVSDNQTFNKPISNTSFRNSPTREASPPKFSVDIQYSDVDRSSSSKLNSPTVTDLRRHLITKNVTGPSIYGVSNADMRVSQVPAFQSVAASLDPKFRSGPLERSSEATAKAILDPRNPAPSSKGFDVSKVIPATAHDTTSVLGMLDIAGSRPAQNSNQDPSCLSSQAAEQASHNSFRPPSQLSNLPHERFSSTYEGRDANIRYLLERVFLDSYREPLPEFGPIVMEGIPRRKAFRQFFGAKEKSSRSSNGNLIGYLLEHTAAVSSIVVSPDFVFFISGSHDGTVKVWDSVRLEKNVTSRSRFTFNQGGQITQLCMLERSHCVASASTNGSLWVHRIDVNLDGALPTYVKIELIRQHKLDAGEYIISMTHFNTPTSSDLMYTTNKSRIVTLDLRTMRITQVLNCPKHLGPPSGLFVDQQKIWSAVGTIRGYMSLWDLRFGLLLRTWKISDGPIHQLSVHPTQGKGRWIVVAALSTIDPTSEHPTNQVVQVWDLEHDRLVETFLISTNSSDGAVDRFRAQFERLDGSNCRYSTVTGFVTSPTHLTASNAIELLLQSKRNPETPHDQQSTSANFNQILRHPAIYSFVIGSRYHESLSSSGELITVMDDMNITKVSSIPSGYLITGGEDRKIRFWDLSGSARSNIISGLEIEEERPQFKSDTSNTPAIHVEHVSKVSPNSNTSRRSNTVPRSDANPMVPHRATIVASHQQTLLRNHGDAILAIAVTDLPFRCIISADRAGAIHVYEYKDRKRFRVDE